MDFSLFGIGFPQIMLIFVIALIVFGPDRLPGMARQAGRYINQLRRLTQDARSEIQNLTKDLDIRDDLNSVKNDLLNIKNDLTATAGGLSKDFENIRKDISLRDDAGNTMGAQREQYTYQVTDIPAADGSEGVRIEETITRETIIQDALENTPTTATEVLSSTTSSDDSPVIDSAIAPSEIAEPRLRVINPARPMDAYNSQAEPGELTATESVEVSTEPVKPTVDNPFAVPYPEAENLTAASNGVEAGERFVAENTEAAPAFSFYGTPAADFATVTPSERENREWEDSLEKTRQEFNERIDKLENQFLERLDRVEKLLASQFVRVHQEQGG